MSFRVLITGSRGWVELAPIRQAFVWVMERHGLSAADITVVHGGARGADLTAAQIADVLGMRTEAWPADWKTHGRKAGPMRNAEMVAAGADVCLAFPLPDSVGTHDCIRRARAAGIPTYVYPGGTKSA